MYGHNSRGVVSAVVLAAFVSIAILMPASPSRAASDVKIEWLTWGFYRITSPGGKVILINPWYANPDSSFTLDDIPEGDIILITSGHGDEIGNTLEIGAKTGATIVASHEVIAQKFREADRVLATLLLLDTVVYFGWVRNPAVVADADPAQVA